MDKEEVEALMTRLKNMSLFRPIPLLGLAICLLVAQTAAAEEQDAATDKTSTDKTSTDKTSTDTNATEKKSPPKVPLNPQQAQAEYEAGLADYQKGRYRSASVHFRASIDKDPQAKNHCMRRLYLAHCFAALKELDKAIPAYQDIVNSCYGGKEYDFAKKCMEQLQPKAKVSLGKGILDRITVLSPIESAHIAKHPPVRPEYISMVKACLQRLPPKIYKEIDQSECTITIAPNIVDKWPDSADELTPGKTTKLSQDEARTYGLQVYFWERPLESSSSGKKVLGAPFPADQAKVAIYTQFGKVACELEGIFEDPVYKLEYDKDVEGIPETMKTDPWMMFYLQKKMGAGQVAASVMENLLQGRPTRIQEYFPRCTEWIKKKFKL